MASQDQDSGHGHGDRAAAAALNSTRSLRQQHSNSLQPRPPPQKKQVRRRLHTTRPYQERLLNMAEARREIVAALKFHRATMKEAEEQREKHQKAHLASKLPQPVYQPMNFLNYQFYGSSIPSSSSFFHHMPPQSSPNQLDLSHWNIISPIPPLIQTSVEVNSLPLTLPTKTLGLNLNLGDFDKHFLTGSSTALSIYSTPSPSLPPTSSMAVAVPQEAEGKGSGSATGESKEGRQLPDNEALAEEMRSIGERHQMEWNDQMNLATSAWWNEFLKGMENQEEAIKRATEECCGGGGLQTFDEVMEFPQWMDSSENSFQSHLVEDCFSNDHFPDALPRMEIGDIEGIDGDWFP
ncbi:hypothetical protein SAY86_002367 [Trapa natans]|uniref:Uncharacterized protein n=1 Tax=Trapa natans TaxID=22666 RepID=A0AAN7LQ30_TRANT|nr:hypothetical protein SAY86_002367 [Trapa natans]